MPSLSETPCANRPARAQPLCAPTPHLTSRANDLGFRGVYRSQPLPCKLLPKRQSAGSFVSTNVPVADDSGTMRRILIHSLHAVGISSVVGPAHGGRAVAVFRPGTLDMVLTDWNMPGRSRLAEKPPGFHAKVVPPRHQPVARNRPSLRQSVWPR